MRLLPALALDPPPRYVAFVAAHLEPLRYEAAVMLGGAGDAEQFYPEVLTEVALRWRWLELGRALLHRPDIADSYLRRAFVRRCRRWRADRDPTQPDDLGIEVCPVEEVWTVRRPRAVRSSGASRVAAFVRPAPSERRVLAEAALAWWHAYEAHRRHRLIAALVAAVLVVAVLWRISNAAAI